MQKRRLRAGMQFLAVLIPILSCQGGSLEMNSARRTVEIRIDGSDAEWQNDLAYVESANVSVGAFNDAESLYLCLVTTDRSVQQQIRTGGLAVWLDATRKNRKTFGIRFPVGRPADAGGAGGPTGRGGPVGKMDRADTGEMREEMQKAFEAMPASVEILGPGEKDRQEVPLTEAGGLETKIGFENGRFVYELKVPLVRTASAPFAVAAENPVAVSTCFQTELFRPEKGRERPAGQRGRGGGGPPPGGMGGMDPGGLGGGQGGPPPGGMDGGPMGDRPSGSESEKPMKIWIEIRLAAAVR
jgi:hypothetical protein